MIGQMYAPKYGVFKKLKISSDSFQFQSTVIYICMYLMPGGSKVYVHRLS